MAEPLIFVNSCATKEGKLDAYKDAVPEKEALTWG